MVPVVRRAPRRRLREAKIRALPRNRDFAGAAAEVRSNKAVSYSSLAAPDSFPPGRTFGLPVCITWRAVLVTRGRVRCWRPAGAGCEGLRVSLRHSAVMDR